jgi:hypothetical protein
MIMKFKAHDLRGVNDMLRSTPTKPNDGTQKDYFRQGYFSKFLESVVDKT